LQQGLRKQAKFPHLPAGRPAVAPAKQRIPLLSELRRVTEEWTTDACAAITTLASADRGHLNTELSRKGSTRGNAYRRAMDRAARATQWAVAFASGEGHRPEVVDKLRVGQAEQLWRGVTIEVNDFKTSAAYGTLGLSIAPATDLSGLTTQQARTHLAEVGNGSANVPDESLETLKTAVAAGKASATQLLLRLYLGVVRPLQLHHLQNRTLDWTSLPLALQPAILITNLKSAHLRAGGGDRPRVGRGAKRRREREASSEDEDDNEAGDGVDGLPRDQHYGLRLRTTCRYLTNEYLSKLAPPARLAPSDLRHIISAGVQLGVAAAAVTGQQAEIAAVARGHSAQMASTTYCVRTMSGRLRSTVARAVSAKAHGPELTSPMPHADTVAVAALVQVRLSAQVT
jgi:hypothetical protein